MSTIYFDGDTFQRGGLNFKVRIEHDQDHSAPWIEHDGHGPVRETGYRNSAGHVPKRAGERVLYKAYRHGTSYLYDWTEATRIAHRDGWGLAPEKLAALEAKLGRSATDGEVKAESVQLDFEYLRGWLNDEWHYVWVSVQNMNGAGFASLGGIESIDDSYITEVVHELADQIIDTHEHEVYEISHWAARGVVTTNEGRAA